ncbi:unnamed protein product [Arabidopsis arenosa]|uniref:BED-type domain-containing protein n=1 Tax=Arabidopsis arenosa TaxID=38785 RepID=A0A8S1ZLW2_ARAAE|nr:unnamed protein product [Arabidopsis arenosa]
MDNEDEFPHGGDGGQTSADTSQSKSLVSVSRSVKRSRTSDIWNHFTLEEDENSDKRAYCKKCPKQYLMLPTTGTSNLIRHHGKCSMGVDVERKTVKIDHKVAREKFSRIMMSCFGFLCVILAMGAVLDPRMKFKLLKRCYDELDPTTSQAKIDFLEDQLIMLFGEYRKAFPLTPVVSSTRAGSGVSGRGRENLDVLDDLFDLDDVPEVEETKSALDMYLEDPKLEMENHPNLNVLQYWKENRHRFGALAYMAMDVLSIPITSVASESSFSIGSHVINKYRSRLLPSNVQALLCTRSWLYGFVIDDEDDKGETVVIRSDPASRGKEHE